MDSLYTWPQIVRLLTLLIAVFVPHVATVVDDITIFLDCGGGVTAGFYHAFLVIVVFWLYFHPSIGTALYCMVACMNERYMTMTVKRRRVRYLRRIVSETPSTFHLATQNHRS